MSTERLNEGMYNKLAISQLEQDRIDGVEDEEVKEEKIKGCQIWKTI